VRELAADLTRWREHSERFALATVVATRHSAPRPIGSKLAVTETGRLAGSVSRGCVENEVVEHAREVLAGGAPRLLTFGISDDQALDVGLPCGGEIDVFVALPDDDVTERLLAAVEGGERVASATVVEGAGLGSQALVTEKGELVGADGSGLAECARDVLEGGRSSLRELSGGKAFAELYEPLARLVVIGAVDIAEALCQAAAQLGWATMVADPRAKLATRERIPSAGELLVDWPEQALERAAPDHSTAIVVLTHEERFDVPALAAALTSDAFYVGALGSRRTQAKRRERLLEEGLSEPAVERIAGPCGLDVGAESPAEMAVSILAEILAVRAGREGGRLLASDRRIHAGAV
jgi:xanthine dehydrogenase accessory factor